MRTTEVGTGLLVPPRGEQRRDVHSRRAEEWVRYRRLPLPARVRQVANGLGHLAGRDPLLVYEEHARPRGESRPRSVAAPEPRWDRLSIRRQIRLDEPPLDEQERAHGIV